ncbi:YraN family protein [Chachezhania sediminis]|uniref:YraN family protein n=1 Tax=Chachezhania sediminis TaxID=2599291 RepID=UPI00131CE9C3|nr:YraN family protein [Chachezhania sediminis]
MRNEVGQEHGYATARSRRGAREYRAGLAAEQRIAQDYERRGLPVARQRWRGTAGEIDLIARDGAGLIFIEVKKSRTFDRAAERLGPRQMERICRTAQEFLAGEPMGQLTEMRFDVALVDGQGQFRIIENAFGDF